MKGGGDYQDWAERDFQNVDFGPHFCDPEPVAYGVVAILRTDSSFFAPVRVRCPESQ